MEEKRSLRFLIPALLVITLGACGAAIYFWLQNVDLRNRAQSCPCGEAS
jgi:hypothetical protein